MREVHDAPAPEPPPVRALRGVGDWIGRSRARLAAAVALTSALLFCGLPALPARVLETGRIAPGHQLRVEKRHPRTGALFRAERILVDDAGTIPLGGKRVDVAGLTADELAGMLAARYARRERPRPRVVVRASRPVRIAVEGPRGVLDSGLHTVPAGTTLVQAFELLRPAPGFAPGAVELVRGGRAHAHDLVSMAARAQLDPVLADGDRIVLRAEAAERSGTYWLLGRVDRPGRRALDGVTLESLVEDGEVAAGRILHVVRGWPAKPQLFRIPPGLTGLPLEAGDMVLVGEGKGLLAECAPLAALVMNLGRGEPVVLASVED